MSRARAPRVLVVVGTRPEAVKLAPLVRELRRRRAARVILLSTGQHRDLARRALAEHGLSADEDLRVMRPGRGHGAALLAAFRGIRRVLSPGRFDLVIVQGDTVSALAGALAAKSRGIAVAHLEAGLRTGRWDAPFPEEACRVAIDRVAALLLAPTRSAAAALRRERVSGRVVVTGNTVVDALRASLRRPGARALPAGVPRGRRLVTVTLHRRETRGAPMAALLEALRRAAGRAPGTVWVCPVHPHPAVRRAFARLKGDRRFLLLPPLPHARFLALLARSAFAVTDSGGVQEEAPALGVPFLVARAATERPEALGRWGRLVGVDPGALEAAASRWATRAPRPGRGAPFGDGRAASRAARAVAAFLRAQP